MFTIQGLTDSRGPAWPEDDSVYQCGECEEHISRCTCGCGPEVPEGWDDGYAHCEPMTEVLAVTDPLGSAWRECLPTVEPWSEAMWRDMFVPETEDGILA